MKKLCAIIVLFFAAVFLIVCAAELELWLKKNQNEYLQAKRLCKAGSSELQSYLENPYKRCSGYYPELKLTQDQQKEKENLEATAKDICGTDKADEYSEEYSSEPEKPEKPEHKLKCVCKKAKCSLFQRDLELGILGTFGMLSSNRAFSDKAYQIYVNPKRAKLNTAFRIARGLCPALAEVYRNDISKYEKDISKYKKDLSEYKKKIKQCADAKSSIDDFNKQAQTAYEKKVKSLQIECRERKPHCVKYYTMKDEYNRLKK